MPGLRGTRLLPGLGRRCRTCVIVATALAIIGASAACAAAEVAAVDDRGKRVALAAPAERIIALAPALTELIYAAGAGERLVGAPSYSDYPAAAAQVTRIGDASRIDFERVLGLAPDLIVGWRSGNRVADIERLERLGFRVLVLEPARLVDIQRSLRVLGAMSGSSVRAQAAADAFAAEAAALRARYAGRPPLRVFYAVWREPLITVNGAHMVSEVIQLCGGSNVFAAMPALAPTVALEDLLARQPDVIVGGRSGEAPEDFAAGWMPYRRFGALRNAAIVYVDPDVLQRHTPRILAGARDLCEKLDAVRASPGAR